ncbi:AarF/ABC1/UbiB kinase family protein [Brevibacterium sandarakinum]|uniref:ABC1 kinase family protein n=1 Tax=Brevibacterium sandarakinum TaxID=629680 RepID=UPI00264B4602|nr:AarF/UbiB family protein [Brevibacterium sandarakinum]MDN5657395.1 AarF/UbiB family protein [Brevibacterium sandarakinum]
MVLAWWFELTLPRIGLGRFAARGRVARWRSTAKRFRVLAVELGGLMIKVGQFLSSRMDVLPPEITKELEGLQDEVSPVPYPQIRTLAEAQLGMGLTDAFASFDTHPLAAASLGQAHSATLTPSVTAELGFAEVVVKVQRPGIADVVEVDLRALRRIAGWLSRVRFVSRSVDMPALVEEFAHVSLEEIDYLHEAANAEAFALDAAASAVASAATAPSATEPDRSTSSARVQAPRIAWEQTTPQVLTMEDVTAIKANDVAALHRAGIDPHEVAAAFAHTMFDQLFRTGFFHADPHPGNIFVTPAHSTTASAGKGWHLTFVDFGMMGHVPETLRTGLRELIIAVAMRDSRRLVASVELIGVLLDGADTDELERSLTGLFARFGGMGFAQLRDVDEKELRAFSTDFESVVRDLPVQLPENLFLIIRSLSMVSGLCSSLNPSFNIWEVVEPYASELIEEEKGGAAGTVAKEALTFVRLTLGLPGRLDSLVHRLENGELSVATPKLDRRVAGLELLARGVISAVLFTGFVIAGAVLLPVTTLGGVLLLIASVPALIHSLLTMLRHRTLSRRHRRL